MTYFKPEALEELARFVFPQAKTAFGQFVATVVSGLTDSGPEDEGKMGMFVQVVEIAVIATVKEIVDTYGMWDEGSPEAIAARQEIYDLVKRIAQEDRDAFENWARAAEEEAAKIGTLMKPNEGLVDASGAPLKKED